MCFALRLTKKTEFALYYEDRRDSATPQPYQPRIPFAFGALELPRRRPVQKHCGKSRVWVAPPGQGFLQKSEALSALDMKKLVGSCPFRYNSWLENQVFWLIRRFFFQ
jgi:hypothetical protein